MYWPVARQTLASAAAGELDALRSDETLTPLLDILETSPELGDFGVYGDVFEACLGVEGFTVRPGARPSHGVVGGHFLSSTLAITTYVDASMDDDELSHVLTRITDVHPWEVPVVELSAPLELISRA
ncbi:hypothetical protein [Nonomuraea sp. NPDC049400]|uniref:hypothetical protein n=1 Tax=Nonomuraea sp. NPDC049400 TaxID=3364352 RepID=UPI00378AFB61